MSQVSLNAQSEVLREICAKADVRFYCPIKEMLQLQGVGPKHAHNTRPQLPPLLSLQRREVCLTEHFINVFSSCDRKLQSFSFPKKMKSIGQIRGPTRTDTSRSWASLKS